MISQYLKQRTQFVQVGREKSMKWTPEGGVFAGAVLAGTLYNIGTSSQSIDAPPMSEYADDCGAVVTTTKIDRQ